MFEECLYFNTNSLARLVEHQWSNAFKKFGLTPAQAFMLRMVLSEPGRLSSELAGEMNIAKATATRVFDKLQEKQFIKRKLTADDKRHVYIYPTKNALDICDELNAASKEVTRTLKQSLGESHFLNSVSNIRKIAVQLKKEK